MVRLNLEDLENQRDLIKEERKKVEIKFSSKKYGH